MRTTLQVLAAAGLLGLTATAFAAAESPAQPADKAAAVPAKPEKKDKVAADEMKTVMLTGSNLPQKVTKLGRITDSAQPVTVISHDDLERSGAMNLADAMRKVVPTMH